MSDKDIKDLYNEYDVDNPASMIITGEINLITCPVCKQTKDDVKEYNFDGEMKLSCFDCFDMYYWGREQMNQTD